MSAMDDEKADELIVLVAEYRELYDLQNKYYTHSQRKDNIWREIASKLNETPDKCKTKWRNLRDGFQRALKNAKTKSGQAAKSTRKWRYYDAMSFLLPFLKMRETHSNIVEVHLEHDETDEDTTLSDLDPSSESVSEDIPSHFTEFQTKRGTPLSNLSSVRSSERTKSTESSRVQHKRNISKNREEEEAQVMPKLFREFLDEKKSKRIERSAKPEQADPLQQFFLCMSKTVNTFPPLYQAQVKSKVFEIVNSTEVMLLSGNNRSTVNSAPSTSFTYPQDTSQSTDSQLQSIFHDIPPSKTSTNCSKNMQASRTSTADSILNSSSSGTTDGTRGQIHYSCYNTYPNTPQD